MMVLIKEYTFGGKKLGKLIGDVYYTHRNHDIHYYFKGRGYPISDAILRSLARNGCKVVCIIEDVNPVIKLRCFLRSYLKKETFRENNYDLQRCVPRDEMFQYNEYDELMYEPSIQKNINEFKDSGEQKWLTLLKEMNKKNIQ